MQGRAATRSQPFVPAQTLTQVLAECCVASGLAAAAPCGVLAGAFRVPSDRADRHVAQLRQRSCLLPPRVQVVRLDCAAGANLARTDGGVNTRYAWPTGRST